MLFKRQKYTWAHELYVKLPSSLFETVMLLMGRGKIKGQSNSKSVSLKEAEYFIYVAKVALSCL